MSKYDYTLIRTAAQNWECACCGKIIKRETRYEDHGWYTKGRWHHTRRHITCEEETIEYPIPVSLQDGTKEWLLGVVHQMDGTLALLTRDWEEGGKYHFREYVYNEHGRKIFSKSLKNI